MLTQVELRFFEGVPHTLHDIDKNLERIAVALEKLEAGTKEDNKAEEQATDKPLERHVREIDFTDLSARVLNVFKLYNIKTPEQAAQYSRAAYQKVRSLGNKSVNEIEVMLKKNGCCFGDRLRLQKQVNL